MKKDKKKDKNVFKILTKCITGFKSYEHFVAG